ncbi:hypothetical protein A7976_06420 [Methylobacillus sp. MM3]|nr:hypothetical protein A7976_06420 [Methylobacillus sp. MM3]
MEYDRAPRIDDQNPVGRYLVDSIDQRVLKFRIVEIWRGRGLGGQEIQDRHGSFFPWIFMLSYPISINIPKFLKLRCQDMCQAIA